MKNKKITILLLIVFAFAAMVLIYTIKSSGDDNGAKSLAPVGVTDTRADGENVKINQALSGQGEEIIRLLSVLKGVDIDANFFDNPFFESFKDFSVQLPVANIGVSNPFAPFGGGEE